MKTRSGVAEEIHGEAKTMGEVCLDDGNYGEMAFRARPTHQNQATAQLPRENHYNGGAI